MTGGRVWAGREAGASVARLVFARMYAFVVAVVVVIIGAGVPVAVTAQGDSAALSAAWSRLTEDSAPLLFGGEPLLVDEAAVGEWRALREGLGFGTAPLATSSAGVASIASSIVLLRADGHMALERALNAAGFAAGALDERRAERWDSLLADAGSLDEAALLRRTTWLVLFDRGSAAAVLPAVCLPSEAAMVERLGRLVAAETWLPDWRFGSPRDPEPALPPLEELEAYLSGGGVFVASLAAAVATRAVRGSYDPLLPEAGQSAGEPCDPAAAVAAAELGSLSREAFARASEGVRALFETHAMPRALVRRAALHRYLLTDAPSLELLAELGAESEREASLLRALAAGARGDAQAMSEEVATLGSPTDPFTTWVFAEADRQAGRYDSARRGYDLALAADAFFAAALLGRASALVHSGRADEALADLQHLHLTFPDDPAYGRWINALDRRLR